ncbi:hypothetical protein BJD12_11325 [Xanthomonas vesicatoria ATCC 35937]|nr:hypothetical protein BI313_14305 [Xanthomonas vesicatoria]APP77791.1 hypothetical protein BJD12_11325 [Xanthomonas vesicatoria ATCC 35937]
MSGVGRGRGALTARGTRRRSIHGASVAASMPPHGPARGEDTALVSKSAALRRSTHADRVDWSLPAHRRGTLRNTETV